MNQTNNENSITAAAAKLESLKQSILDGNKTLTPGDLSNALNELAFCELREEAKKHREEKAIEATRKARLLELQKQLSTVSDSRKSVDAKFSAFEKSLHEYLAFASNYQNSLNEIRSSLQTAGLYPGEQVAVVSGVAPGQTFFGIQITDIRRVLSIGAASASNVLPNDVVKPLIEKSLGEFNRHF